MVSHAMICGLAAVSLAASSFSSLAASLTSVQGQIQVSRAGGPFKAVTGPTFINPGDVVRADIGSSAQIVYSSGASVPVASGAAMTVVADASAVLSSLAFQGAPGPWAASTIPAEPAPSAAPSVDAPPAAAGGGASFTTIAVVGGVVVAGAGVLAVASKADSKKSSASP
jgi:hypothetical protein